MDGTAWSVRDEAWVARYRTSLTKRHVPALVLEQRVGELLAAVREVGTSAEDLFGDAEALALEDAAELATAEEAVRSSLGGGLRPVLWEIGGTLTGIGAVATVLTSIRGGWSVDIDIAHALVAAGVLVLFVGWVVVKALFAAGRSVGAVGALVATSAVAVGAIASAAGVGKGHIAVSGAPVPVLALGMLAPGITALVTSHRMQQQALRESWDDGVWLKRFRGSLKARLMPAAAARGHVAEIEQVLGSGRGSSAYAEFGHPLVLAREIADADPGARARRWWVSTTAGTCTPLVIAILVLTNQTWGSATIPCAVVLVLAAPATLVTGWDDRPWAKRR